MGGVGERLKYGWGAAEWESGRQQVGAGQESGPMPGAYFIASGHFASPQPLSQGFCKPRGRMMGLM